ncbi:hypothetical protein I6E84_09535 [Psychrobacter sp. SCQQ22]|uniref:hypothetical protein n=1 Tax=Psychrobacter sp. SCQQ22 TaxID=2792059 RepID=UPI0018CC8EAB|nr:hypothetical protein [Psychrobacter sp. SCQQ22]MBH0086458.1 hypothetical protein [Psychrobacter sp. SCQQ22]
MYNFTSLSSLAFIIFGCILSATSLAKSAEAEFDDRFYMSKICTAYMSKEDHGYCDDGYVLKSETLEGGQVKETLLMDGIGSYGWNHTSLKKIDKDTYHVYIGCGNPCGANMLFGRGDKEQNFGRYFNFDLNSQCSVAYNHDKQLWTASRFFSDKEIALPLTYDPDAFAAYPKYDVEFDKKGHLIVKEYFSEEVVQTLPNPCTSR